MSLSWDINDVLSYALQNQKTTISCCLQYIQNSIYELKATRICIWANQLPTSIYRWVFDFVLYVQMILIARNDTIQGKIFVYVCVKGNRILSQTVTSIKTPVKYKKNDPKIAEKLNSLKSAAIKVNKITSYPFSEP